MESEAYHIVYSVEKKHWFFVARRHIVSTLVDRYFSKEASNKLLDIGCGTGGLTEVLGRFGTVTGVDRSDEALHYYLRDDSLACCADAVRLPFEFSSFDYIVALDVLEHLSEDLLGLDEFYRVLKPYGRALLTVPAFQFLWGRLDDVAHHFRRYTRSLLQARVEKVGFRVLKLSYMNMALFPAVLLSRRTESFHNHSADPNADLRIPAYPLNAILESLFRAESHFLRRWNLPFGVSLVCVLERT